MVQFNKKKKIHINTPTFSTPVILHTYLPMKMVQTECSETSAYNIQTPGNCPEESIQHSEHGGSFKSRRGSFILFVGCWTVVLFWYEYRALCWVNSIS